jgi:hypothetical protein
VKSRENGERRWPAPLVDSPGLLFRSRDGRHADERRQEQRVVSRPPVRVDGPFPLWLTTCDSGYS